MVAFCLSVKYNLNNYFNKTNKMKALIPIFLSGLLIPMSTWACINTYTIELSPHEFESAQQRIQYYQDELDHFQRESEKPYSVQTQNDYAVLLILTGRYQQAIEVLEKLERHHPHYLPKTAVNLGTAYELMGKLPQARKWIRVGMQRDPNIHEGSEWIHMNILNAKLNHADVNWLNQHPLLNLKFGQGYFPQPNHLQQNQLDHSQLEKIFEQAKLQVAERKRFVFGQDPILARVYYDLANIEQSLYLDQWLSRIQYNPEANDLIRFSQVLGLQQDATIQKRIKMIESSKLVRLWMQIQDYMMLWMHKDK